MHDTLKSKSKFLSLVLRHKPEEIGITLDSAGWVGVDELLDALRPTGTTGGRAASAKDNP